MCCVRVWGRGIVWVHIKTHLLWNTNQVEGERKERERMERMEREKRERLARKRDRKRRKGERERVCV